MIPTRSARAVTSSIAWVVSSTAFPPETRRRVSHRSRLVEGSTPVENSSIRTTAGLPSNAIASDSLRYVEQLELVRATNRVRRTWLPPDNLLAYL